MIACWIHQPALRRHFDEGGELPQHAQNHLRACPDCRTRFETETRVVGALRTAKPRAVEPSPFLHARIMRAVGTEKPRERSFRLAPAIALTCLTLGIFFLALRQNEPEPVSKTVAQAPRLQLPESFEAPALFENTSLEKPFETEIRNLQEDTRNAARALAASFMPTPAAP